MRLSQQDVERRVDLLRERCRAAGLAFTHQRRVIYRALVSSDSHPTPEAVYEQVRLEVPSISLATVYKNIRTFLNAGLLREVNVLHATQRLDANLDPHYHLVCVKCKSVADLEGEAPEPLRWKGSAPEGFRVERFNLEILGLCARCARGASGKSTQR